MRTTFVFMFVTEGATRRSMEWYGDEGIKADSNDDCADKSAIASCQKIAMEKFQELDAFTWKNRKLGPKEKKILVQDFRSRSVRTNFTLWAKKFV